VAEVATDPDLPQEIEIPTQTPIKIPNKKGKVRAETKKANRDHALVPLATESRKIHAATAAVTITLLEPATNVKMTKRMVRQNHRTSKQT
jgi:hypothetical protein